MTEWQTSNRKGLYVRHAKRCGARRDRRCSCEPSYRGKRRNPATGQPEYSPTSKERSEFLTWLEGGHKATEAVRERHAAGPTFGELAGRWRAGVENGSIAKRRGRGRYSPTTWRRYGRLLAAAGALRAIPAWRGIRRARRRTHGCGQRHLQLGRLPTRRLVARNPAREIEPPPGDEVKRLRIADPAEAAHLLAPLDPDDALPYAIAFYGGPRRSDLERLEWPDVDLEAQLIHMRASKSEAGTNRRAPFAAPLLPLLRAASLRQGRPAGGRVLGATRVMNSRLPERADRAWDAHDPPLRRVTLHECRHTYASYLMAAGYTLREIMEYLGHSSLSATERYVKLLPRPAEGSPAERLNAYVARAAEHPGW